METMIIDNSRQVYNNMSYHAQTPDGTMYVFVMEDENGNPLQIKLIIGKAGSAVSAWADALESVINIALLSGTKLETIRDTFKDITTDKNSGSRFGTSVNVRSGPEGLYTCLFRYLKEKNASRDAEITQDTIQKLDVRAD